MTVGTPAYMAPEQGAGDPATDHRADLYAWGVVAYEMLAGAHPFEGKRSAYAWLVAHLTETPPPLHERAPSVPAALAATVMGCLAKDPDERPRDAAALLAAIESAGASGAASPTAMGGGATSRVVAVLPFESLSPDPSGTAARWTKSSSFRSASPARSCTRWR